MEESYYNEAPDKPQSFNRNLKPGGVGLLERHARYLADRGIPQDVAEAAGYWSATKPNEHPEEFAERQRRRHPSLIAPQLSPDGETVGFQKRDDRPAVVKGTPLKWVSPKGATPVLSVHPDLLAEVRFGTGPLWVVEGLTRAHALTALGIPAVSYAGCYSWQKGGEPLECWRHVNLKGRLVYDVPDADHRTNENVQIAQQRRVAFLESRGARVLVVRVPEVNGDENAGLDDYIAAGGDVEKLAAVALAFVPVEVGRERLKRDDRLRVLIAAKALEASELPTHTTVDCNAKKLARWMLESPTPRHGKLRERGIEIHPSLPQMAEGIRVGSYQTVSKALDHLQALGFLKRNPGPRRKREATRYTLLDPSGGGGAQSVKMGGAGVAEKESLEHKREEESSLLERESYACLHSTHLEPESYTCLHPAHIEPLRNSKLVHTFVWHGGRREVVHSDYFRRYGSKREEIIRYVLERGAVELRELHERFGSRTSKLGRFFTTWVKPMVDDGVLVSDSGVVGMAEGWSEALERVRERGYEEEDNQRQSEKYAKRRQEFIRRMEGEESGEVRKPEPTPDLAGPERVADMVARADERDRVARIEEQRRKVGMTPEVFLGDAMQDASGFGWRELRALWVAKGGNPNDLRLAVKEPYQFRREHDSGPLYVMRGDIPERDPAPVRMLREPKLPEKVEGIYQHDAFCDCDWCDEPVKSAYAKAWRPHEG